MSWLFSQALVEEYSEESYLDGEPSAQSSGKPTQQSYCAPDKMTAFSRLSRFGMTFKPLTESRGEELLTLYLEDFHAKTLAQQEEAQELTESEAGCGEKWRASFTKYDPDSRLWKTHQCSLLGDLEPFLETWPQWGLMRNGECWEQRTLEQTIRGTESGLLLNTPPPPTMAYADSTHEQRNKRTERTQSEYTNIDGASELAYTTQLFGNVCNTNRQRQKISEFRNCHGTFGQNHHWWKVEPDVGRVADGVAARVDRLKAIGNGQVPLCAATAWRILSES